MKGIKTTVALTPAEKECLVLYLILLVAFLVQRNAQGISPLRRYLCHHTARISEATSVFYNFQVGVETKIELILARSGIFEKAVNFSEMTVCLYIDQASESDGEKLVDYVLCHRMFPVTKRNLKKYPQQKEELLCSTQNKFLNLRKTSYPSDQVSDYNES